MPEMVTLEKTTLCLLGIGTYRFREVALLAGEMSRTPAVDGYAHVLPGEKNQREGGEDEHRVAPVYLVREVVPTPRGVPEVHKVPKDAIHGELVSWLLCCGVMSKYRCARVTRE